MEVERVQALASGADLNELPAKFIRPAHERPENTKPLEGVSVPVISLAESHDVLVKEIYKACSEWGFFLLKDHGISPGLIEKLQEVGIEFFKQPQEEKEKYANDPSTGKFEGYGTKMTKNLDEKVEWVDYFFHLMSPPSNVNHQIWPQTPSSYREVTEVYNKELLKVTDTLLELLSEGLGLEGKVLKSHVGGDEIELEMKINMYPPCPQPQLALGVEPHTDMSALTLLVPNDVPGLQVWKDDYWVAVDYLPNALFVHVGDQIEVLSNGKYKSVLHRSTVNKERTRMSWAVFCAPPHKAMIGPLPELVDEPNPAKYSTKTFAEYRYRKFNKLPQ
ncbi:Flavonol synthase/flavanone 3-hydroxylase [Vitis vinifera]|uniref:Flavonol synthase/flavanone 3-hydroxylase n=2 Tax=Vitis vinifera TaxID=29760 RepID=A0A438KMK0_VITVI|nr:Flavonol synthase/flavanone 3-hydroxylase [Vitis vinifera]RVX22432.1 Flavonol synthase/flavanone 3-hydroxylase [Vitis vinifera]BAE75810.1 flavonol synthase [Vitis vinifera]